MFPGYIRTKQVIEEDHARTLNQSMDLQETVENYKEIKDLFEIKYNSTLEQRMKIGERNMVEDHELV
jgi:hypothetical protein